jgi:ABC-type proline/glycine betaine transport system substrate-binding protein
MLVRLLLGCLSRSADDQRHADHLEVRRAAVPSPVKAHVGAPANDNAHVDAVANSNAHVGAAAKLDSAIVRTQAKETVVGLGWKPAIAHAAVAAACSALGTEVNSNS